MTRLLTVLDLHIGRTDHWDAYMGTNTLCVHCGMFYIEISGHHNRVRSSKETANQPVNAGDDADHAGVSTA